MIYGLRTGQPPQRAMEEAAALLCAEKDHEEVLRAVEGARSLAARGVPTPDEIESLGGGWVGEEALAVALACWLTVEGDTPRAFADALWRSVLHSGDSDSTGSLAGNLLGAQFGTSCLPPPWLEDLELRETLEKLAEDLYLSAIVGRELDYAEYPPN